MEALNRQENIQAAALYGSVARDEFEPHSDIDLLLVCHGGHKREVYDKVYPLLSERLNRVSLSIYSPREISFLAKAQSLFLLHLKRESLLLFDHDEVLTDALKHFVPKLSYEDDFRKSLELVMPLKTIVQGSPNNLHRLAYSYSLFRVYGVYILANRGIFEFSKAKMAEYLTLYYPELSKEIELLSGLRALNATFFSANDVNAESVKGLTRPSLTAEESVAALAGLAKEAIPICVKPYRDAVHEFLEAAAVHPQRLGYRLRTWFLLLVYDGLNLYASRHNVRELSSFTEKGLRDFSGSCFPPQVRDAALESLEYLHNYPLKYFLLEDSKIPVLRASDVLLSLSEIVV